MYKLIFDKGSLSGKTLDITDDKVLLGRDPDCRVELADDGVSRQHCYIEKKNDGFYLCDMGSTNGVYVNGKRVHHHKLATGDHLKIGSAACTFELPRRTGALSAAKEEKKEDKKEEKPPGKVRVELPKPGKPKSEEKPPSAPVVKRDAAMPSHRQPRRTGANFVLTLCVLAVIGLGAWVWMLQNEIRSLRSQRNGAASGGNVVTGTNATVERLQREVDELKRLLHQPRGEQNTSPQPQPPATPPSAALPGKVKIVQWEKDQDAAAEADEKILLTFKIRPQTGDAQFDAGSVRVVVECFDKSDSGAVGQSSLLGPSVLKPDAPWVDFAAQKVGLTFMAPSGYRQQEKTASGQGRQFHGFVVRAYYRDTLQDEAASPPELLKLEPAKQSPPQG